MALLGHLDIVRELPRVLRRSGAPMVYTQGFHPKPDMTFGPALSLGVPSLSEYVDLRLDAVMSDAELADLVARMNASTPKGLRFTGAVLLGDTDPAVAKIVTGARYAIVWARSTLREALGAGGSTPREALGAGGSTPREAGGSEDEEAWIAARCAAAMRATELPHRRDIDGIGKIIDVRKYLVRAEIADEAARSEVARAGIFGDLVIATADVDITAGGSAKASEVAIAIAGDVPHRAVRLALVADVRRPEDAVAANGDAATTNVDVAMTDGTDVMTDGTDVMTEKAAAPTDEAVVEADRPVVRKTPAEPAALLVLEPLRKPLRSARVPRSQVGSPAPLDVEPAEAPVIAAALSEGPSESAGPAPLSP